MKSLFDGIYKGKKVLITGDTGFKGSWLAVWMKELGADVFGYALPPKREIDNFVQCNLYKKINHIDGDVRDQDKLADFFSQTQPEIAFHLAAQPLVIDSYEDPHFTFETNLIGTVNFFESIRKTKSVKAAINITSDKCYQNNEWLWGYREIDPMGGKDPYSASKGAAELITSSYLHSFFLSENTCNIASARAGNVIGGGDWADYRIVPDFFKTIEKNEILELRNPYSTRPWQHVLEPLSGYLLLGKKLLTEGKDFSGGWNFGPLDQNNYSVEELIKKIIELAGKGSYRCQKNIPKKYEASLLKLDISKAISLLEWKPILDFNETVKLTVNGYLNTDKNLYKSRVEQIEEYIEFGISKNIKWTI